MKKLFLLAVLLCFMSGLFGQGFGWGYGWGFGGSKKNIAPTITGNPSNSAIYTGNNTTFSVTATGTALTYQWQKNGVNLSNAGVYSGVTTSTLTLTSASTTLNDDTFKCIVTGSKLPAATTSNAYLTVLNSPKGWWFASGENDSLIYDMVGTQNRQLTTQNEYKGQVFTGRGLKFNGSTQYAYVSDSGAYDVRNKPFAFSFWMRGVPNSADNIIIGKFAFSGFRGEWGVYATTVNTPSFLIYPASGAAATKLLDVDFDNDSSWHHFIIQIDLPTTKKFYIYKDNIIVDAAGTAIADSLPVVDGKFKFYIGAGNNAATGVMASPSKVSLSDIRIFKNKLLSYGERMAIYKGEIISGTTAWFPCEGTSTTTVYNSINAGKDLTAAAFASNSFVTNLNILSNLNRYGYTHTAENIIIEPDLTALPVTKDAAGNNLVFVGQAKYHLIKVGSDSVKMPDYCRELWLATRNTINTFYSSAGVATHIKKTDLYNVQYGTEYYKANTAFILFNNDSTTIASADHTRLMAYIGKTDLVPSKSNTAVWGGCYQPITTGTVNLSAFTTRSYYMNKNASTRIRQRGTLTSITMYLHTKTNITDITFCLWRLNADGVTFDKISEQSIFAGLTAGQTNTVTLGTPITVYEGDYTGLGTASSSNSACFSSYNTVTDASACYYKIADLSTTNNYAWASLGSVVSSVIPIRCNIDAPLIVGIGNSIMQGQSVFFAWTSLFNSLISNIPAQSINKLYLYDRRFIYQNMGIGGNTSTNVQARFKTDVTDLKPKFVIIEVGVNDLLGASDSSTWIAKYKLMLDSCVVNNIRPVVCQILPWTAGTNAKMQMRDRWNTSLAAICASTYPTAIVINFNGLGMFRVGGDVGNYWDIKTAYNSGDNVHLSLAGQIEFGRLIYVALNPYLSQ
jgi:lysophospholipase L1-like esterase